MSPRRLILNAFLTHLEPASSGPHALAEARTNIHGETALRAQFRALLDAAGNVPGTELEITYVKNDGTVRAMRCTANGPDSDPTRRYCTVWDIENQGYRRVALDTILKLSLSTFAQQQS